MTCTKDVPLPAWPNATTEPSHSQHRSITREAFPTLAVQTTHPADPDGTISYSAKSLSTHKLLGLLRPQSTPTSPCLSGCGEGEGSVEENIRTPSSPEKAPPHFLWEAFVDDPRPTFALRARIRHSGESAHRCLAASSSFSFSSSSSSSSSGGGGGGGSSRLSSVAPSRTAGTKDRPRSQRRDASPEPSPSTHKVYEPSQPLSPKSLLRLLRPSAQA